MHNGTDDDDEEEEEDEEDDDDDDDEVDDDDEMDLDDEEEEADENKEVSFLPLLSRPPTFSAMAYFTSLHSGSTLSQSFPLERVVVRVERRLTTPPPKHSNGPG